MTTPDQRVDQGRSKDRRGDRGAGPRRPGAAGGPVRDCIPAEARMSKQKNETPRSSPLRPQDLVPTVLRGDAVPDAQRPRDDDPRGRRCGASRAAFPSRAWERVKTGRRAWRSRRRPKGARHRSTCAPSAGCEIHQVIEKSLLTLRVLALKLKGLVGSTMTSTTHRWRWRIQWRWRAHTEVSTSLIPGDHHEHRYACGAGCSAPLRILLPHHAQVVFRD